MNLNDFLDFVDAIKNVEKYEAQVKDLRDENERLEKNIAATAKVTELSALLEAAAIDQAEAKKLVKEAKEEAAKLKEAAKVSYDAKHAALVIREGEVAEKLLQASKALEAATTLNTETKETLAKELADVHARKAKLIADSAEVTERLAKLKAVMG